MMRRISSGNTYGLASASPLASQRGSFFFGKKDDANKKDSAAGGAAASEPTSAMKGFDVRRVQEFMKAPPQQQLEMMQKAADMQRSFGKVPGLGLLARKNADVMDRMIKMQQDALGGKPTNMEEKQKLEQDVKSTMAQRGVDPDKAAAAIKNAMSQPPPPSSPPPHRGQRSGPSLDELKKVNLGTEIEALFQELKSVRESKNSYRDKFNAREKEFEDLQKETHTLRDTTANLRSKLQLAEKNVMLLNSETMSLKDETKNIKELQRQNSSLSQKITLLQHNDTQPLVARIQELEAALRLKEAHQSSLQRKLDRTRKRDPLLQFTENCSTGPLQLCRPPSTQSHSNGAVAATQHGDDASASIGDEGKSLVSDAFQQLRAYYDDAQQQAWNSAVATKGAGAKLIVAAARELISSWLGHKAKLDATVHLSGSADDISAMVKKWTDDGYDVENDSLAGGKFIVSSPSTSLTPATLGPYGVIAAMVLAREAPQRKSAAAASPNHTSAHIVSVSPCVSTALSKNANRAVVDYESCRSGGPGGQAANVTETQINAKLSVDGVFLYKTEAQFSRSALANKEAATEKLYTTQLKHWNDRAQRFDANSLLQEISSAHPANSLASSYGAEALLLVESAAANFGVAATDVEVVFAVERIRGVARSESSNTGPSPPA